MEDELGVGVAAEADALVRVFVSYRRDDVPDATDRLARSLIDVLGEERVFLDVDSIEIGAPFADVIGKWVGRCDVLLAVIGRGWLIATDDAGERRLENPKDYVRLEIEAGLSRDIRVVPVLVHDVPMPRASELPETLVPMLDRNAVKLSRTHWEFDVARLVSALQRIGVEKAREATEAARRQAQERSRREDEARAQREAEEQQRQKDEARAQREAEEQQRQKDKARAQREAATPDPSESAPGKAGTQSQAAYRWFVEVEHPKRKLFGLGAREIKDAAVSFGLRKLVTASVDGTARIWDVASGHELVCLQLHARGTVVAFSSDGQLVATGDRDGFARVWEVSNGRELAALAHRRSARLIGPTGAMGATTELAGSVTSATFAPDGRLIATTASDDGARIWDVGTGREVARLQQDHKVNWAVFSADWALAALGRSDNACGIWEISNRRELQHLNAGGRPTTAAFSPDLRLIAVGTRNGMVRLSEIATGRELSALSHTRLTFSGGPEPMEVNDPVSGVAFSPNGKFIATGARHLARIWNIESGRVVHQFDHHPLTVASLAFTPDGQLLITAVGDKALVWTPEAGGLPTMFLASK